MITTIRVATLKLSRTLKNVRRANALADRVEDLEAFQYALIQDADIERRQYPQRV